MNQYLDYIMEQLENLMAIDSPSGFTEKVTDYLLEEYARLGYSAKRTVKGGVIAVRLSPARLYRGHQA